MCEECVRKDEAIGRLQEQLSILHQECADKDTQLQSDSLAMSQASTLIRVQDAKITEYKGLMTQMAAINRRRALN